MTLSYCRKQCEATMVSRKCRQYKLISPAKEKEYEGLLVRTQSITRHPFLRPRQVLPQVCPATARTSCWCDQPRGARSARLRPLEKGTSSPGRAQQLQILLCSTTACRNRREHGRHEESCRLHPGICLTSAIRGSV